jgi:hypothetical protein
MGFALLGSIGSMLQAVIGLFCFAMALNQVLLHRHAKSHLGSGVTALPLRTTRYQRSEWFVWGGVGLWSLSALWFVITQQHSALVVVLPLLMLGTMAVGAYLRSRALLGEHGLVVSNEFIAWERVHNLDWDKDNEQPQYGCTLRWKDLNEFHRVARFWVPRSEQETVQTLFTTHSERVHQSSHQSSNESLEIA